MPPLNLYDYETLAREHLPTTTFDYYVGGSGDEITLKENHRAYDSIKLIPRALVDVSKRDSSTTVLGCHVSMPVLIAPMAFQGMAHTDGEQATARAAHTAGTVMIASTLSNASIAEIAAESGSNTWFQLYMYKDRELTHSLIQRATEAGCTALVVTIDAPIQGVRERDIRNGFHMPAHLKLKNLLGRTGYEDLPASKNQSGLAAYINSLFDPSLTWHDLKELCSFTKLPIILKGIMCAEDTIKAIDCGVAAVAVSNHGGRQLDTAPATIEVLPQIVKAVQGKCEIYIDGGIRRGTDVLKALALGANAVLLGRPILWGLAANGQQGVEHVLGILRNELDVAMGLCGCRTIGEITEKVIYNPQK